MKTFLHHFLFRFNQGFRIFNLNPRVGFSVVIIVLVFMAAKIPENYFPFLALIVTVFVHFSRNDIRFLQKIFLKTWRLLVMLEALIIYVLLVSINIHYHWNQLSLGILLGIFSFVFLIPNSKPKIVFSWKTIPSKVFEWRSFFRKNSLLSIPLYILLVASAYHPASLIFCSLLYLDFFAAVYEKNESKEMLIKYFERTSFETKIKYHIRFFNLLLLPIYVLFIIFNTNEVGVMMYYFLFMNLYLVLVISRKYKLYNHRKSTTYFDMGDGLLYFVAAISILPAGFIIYNNIKDAKNNIKTYVGHS